MSAEDLEKTVRRLRNVELRRAIRGIDPAQARRLLDEAAGSLADAVREQKELHREVERLRAENSDDAIAKALVTATRTGEGIVAEARATATKITAEAEAQAAALLEETASLVEERDRETAAAREQFEHEVAAVRAAFAEERESARAESEAALADARQELDRLEVEAERLRSVVTDTQRRVIEIVQAALDQLEALAADMNGAAAADLLADLRPALDSQPAPAAWTADGQTSD